MRSINCLCLKSMVIAFLIMGAPTICSAKIYTWIGSNGANWDNPSNWRPPAGTIIPNDRTYPSSLEDTAHFDGDALSDCKLTDDIQIRSLKCLPGFKRTINLRTYTLTIMGDADFSHGTIWIQKGTILFNAPEGSTQVFIPKPNWLYPSISKAGGGTLQIAKTPLRVGTFTLKEGILHWTVSHDTVGNLLCTGAAGMVIDNRINLYFTGKYIDFRTLERMRIGVDDTMIFSAASDTQSFTPRQGLLFPNIKKDGKGRVRIMSNPLKAQALVVEGGGTWDWNGKGPDTVSMIQTSEESKMLFNGAIVVISEGDADLRGLSMLDGALATLNFTGSGDQYFSASPYGGPPPFIKHSGKGTLFYGVRQAESAIYLLKSRSKRSVIIVPENYIIREKGISIESGLNIYPTVKPAFYRDTMSPVGVPIGIMVPIRIPNIVVWLRIKALFHRSEKEGNKKRDYLTGTNQIIVGKPFFIKRAPFEYTPFGGWGFNNSLLVSNFWQTGFKGNETHYYSQWIAGVIVRDQFKFLNQVLVGGVLLAFESSFFATENTTKRISLGLTLGY